ncbi:type I-C CRISPR-associated protein Cas5c [Roseofilum sp. BLCC_M91]|uniref:Type I-C CRISPR-associated protein Cas5c n=1 Tax=Roseofilum halophilum BLCC-M91 TaxID=3022259 RepID=A0ABT7BPL8_9CYAN|nr:type I-C CRISPR-associated protein Cas5c [Roseofilum halophilum]MDJ1181137.1 type I-C CRISPR-associated protein Cas5c [Roseofilum halophilum BLCC-M91]
MKLKFTASRAIFTRPELKVEAVSYPIPPPSAIAGMLSSIMWKPEMRYRINQIIMINPIQYSSVMRNMVKSKAFRQNRIDIERDRTQRSHRYLKDLCFIADFDILADDPIKYIAQLNRRVDKGQSFSGVYAGTRECTADFSHPTGEEKPHYTYDGTMDFGLVLHHLNYIPNPKGKVTWKEKGNIVKGDVEPVMFHAIAEQGVIQCSIS